MGLATAGLLYLSAKSRAQSQDSTPPVVFVPHRTAPNRCLWPPEASGPPNACRRDGNGPSPERRQTCRCANALPAPRCHRADNWHKCTHYCRDAPHLKYVCPETWQRNRMLYRFDSSTPYLRRPLKSPVFHPPEPPCSKMQSEKE